MFTDRRRLMLTGIISVVIFAGLSIIGVNWAFGAYESTYRLSGTFTAAGQGLQTGDDVSIRGVDVGKVAGVELVDGRAEIKMDIDSDQKVPEGARAVVRPKTLFGPKFIDIVPGKKEDSGPFLQDGDKIKDTLGGFELERVLADAYPILEAIDPVELAVVVGTMADAGRGLGDEINRTIINFGKIAEVNAAHADDTSQFLEDFATISDELANRADDLVGGAEDLNVALPEINSRSEQLTGLLDEAARLSTEVADILENNREFLRKSVTQGGQTLQVLSDNRDQVVPLVNGLRQYLQTLTEAIHIPLGDGTRLAAVKFIVGGGELCGEGQGETCALPVQPPVQAPQAAPPATLPGLPLPNLPMLPTTLPSLILPNGFPGVPVPTTGVDAINGLLGGGLR